MLKKSLPILFLTLLAIGCKPSPKIKDVEQENGFYLWKTRWNFDKDAYQVLETHHTQVIYLRLFDVDFDEKSKAVAPLGELQYYYQDNSPYEKYQVIPTIFITNHTFKNIEKENIDDLANRIYKKIISHFGEMGERATENYSYSSESENSPFVETSKDFRELVLKDSLARYYYNQVKEIQFDCDWTETTKDKYFQFLTAIQRKFKEKTISSTIRLYQYKYPEKAGVPPVKKGMLMCYNVGDVRDADGPNSIFNKKEILKYFTNKDPYPLPLDYAFPIFEWGAVYRNNQLVKLLPLECFYISDEYYRLISLPKEVMKYEIIDVPYLYGTDFTFEKGDILKIESINYDDVVAVASKVSSINTNPNPKIILFDFDPENVKKHESGIKKIFDCF